MKTIVILAGIPYDHLKQRPQHFSAYFAKKGYEVIYLSITDFIKIRPDSFLSINKRALLKNALFKINQDNVYILKDTTIVKSNLDGISLTSLINKIGSLYKAENLTYIVSFPAWLTHLEGISENSTLIYDCLDDWESFLKEVDMSHKEELLFNERKIAGVANLVLASSKRLYIKMSYLNDNIYYLPNGVWNKDYNFMDTNNHIPSDLQNIQSPIVFFMGAIAEWVNIELIEFIAESRPHYPFVFVGNKRCELPNLPNIYFLGSKKYEELSSYLKYARVAIIPFKVNNLTAAVTPLKFYEYLSSGTPTVTTIMPDIIGLKGSKVALDKMEFLTYIDNYMNLENSVYNMEENKAMETAESFDWEGLLEPLSIFIEESHIKFIEKNIFINQMIKEFTKYEEHELIKNELLGAYNLLGKYQESVELFEFSDSEEKYTTVDYEKIALAYIKQKKYEEAIYFLEKYINKSNLKILSTYIKSLLSEKNYKLLIEIYLLKITGNIYEALRLTDNFLEQNENNIKFMGMLVGLYLDIGEYELAYKLAINTLENYNGDDLERVFDLNTISFLTRSLSERLQYKEAEKIALNLYYIGSEWEEIAVELLSEIYISLHIN